MKLLTRTRPERGFATYRRLRAASLVAAGLAGLSAPPAIAGDAPALSVELNKLEQTGTECRSYMVLSNDTGGALERLSLDLVVFDREGVIDRRLAVELGPLAPGRTQVKVFDMADLDCGQVARVLMNDVLACDPALVDEATTCDAALHVSGRGAVALVR